VPYSISVFYLGVNGFVRVEKDIPFQNRLVYTLTVGTAGFFSNFAGVCGSIKDEQPAEPMESLFRPLLLASLRNARVMDCLTDITVVRLLFDKVQKFPPVARVSCSACHWYGIKYLSRRLEA
jgi:hypothetical protein